jgi:hypothetical protein
MKILAAKGVELFSQFGVHPKNVKKLKMEIVLGNKK